MTDRMMMTNVSNVNDVKSKKLWYRYASSSGFTAQMAHDVYVRQAVVFTFTEWI